MSFACFGQRNCPYFNHQYHASNKAASFLKSLIMIITICWADKQNIEIKVKLCRLYEASDIIQKLHLIGQVMSLNDMIIYIC